MTFKYNNVYINETSTITGPYEADGPLSKLFDKSYEDEILDKIKSEYKKADADRYDVMDYVENAPADKKDKKDGNADDIAITVLLLVVVAGVGLGIYSLRKTN